MRYGYGCEYEDSRGERSRPADALCPEMDYETEFEREARRRLNGHV